jgi:hypothetical protein
MSGVEKALSGGELSRVAIVDASSTGRNGRLFRLPLDSSGFITYACIQKIRAQATGYEEIR